VAGGDGSATPLFPSDSTPAPTPGQLIGKILTMTPDLASLRHTQDTLPHHTRVVTDEELDEMLPAHGYKIVAPPCDYAPRRSPARKYMTTPTPLQTPSPYAIPEEHRRQIAAPDTPLDHIKQSDLAIFVKLLDDKPEEEMSPDEVKDRKIVMLLLKVKNGNPSVRKAALRQLTNKAREFGPGPLFNHLLPLLMSVDLHDQERHLLVKVVDRVLYKLDDLVRPYVHRILVVIEPLLIDEDYYARVEGREIISNLSKAAGLATMTATLRPDIDNLDEYVRNTTARAFSVVACALGIPALLPFLKAVCQSKKSWQARHTGVKIVQQIAILMGCAVLPHLASLVEIIQNGLGDEHQKVQTITGKIPPSYSPFELVTKLFFIFFFVFVFFVFLFFIFYFIFIFYFSFHSSRTRRTRRSRDSIWYRILRFRATTHLGRHTQIPRETARRLPESDRVHHSAYGRGVRVVLLARGRAHPDPELRIAR
jgi:splicing factor 3B subunit 1